MSIFGTEIMGLFAGWCWCWFGLAGAGFLWDENTVGWLVWAGWNQQANRLVISYLLLLLLLFLRLRLSMLTVSMVHVNLVTTTVHCMDPHNIKQNSVVVSAWERWPPTTCLCMWVTITPASVFWSENTYTKWHSMRKCTFKSHLFPHLTIILFGKSN